jgi:branched-chain amino acid transport system permease protein
VTIFAQQVLNGLTLGAQYALMAAGLSLIFGVVRVVNFAHGEFYLVGAYLLYAITVSTPLPYWAAAVVCLAAMAGLGVLFYLFVLYRVIGTGWQRELVATVAASILIANLVLVASGGIPHYVASPLVDSYVPLGAIRSSAQRLLIVLTAVLAFAALYVFLTRTKTGKAMRALSQNRELCRVYGIPVHRIGLLAVVVGAVLAGLAAVTIPPLTVVTPDMAIQPTLKAFAAVIVGGFGDVRGAILAAFALGMVEAIGIGYVSSQYGDVVVFGAMILTLLIRPNGLLGRAIRA